MRPWQHMRQHWLPGPYLLFIYESRASLKVLCTTAYVRLEEMSIIIHLKMNIINLLGLGFDLV